MTRVPPDDGLLTRALRTFRGGGGLADYGLDRAYADASPAVRLRAARAIAVPERLRRHPDRAHFARFLRTALRGSLDALASLVHRDLFPVAFATFIRDHRAQ